MPNPKLTTSKIRKTLLVVDSLGSTLEASRKLKISECTVRYHLKRGRELGLASPPQQKEPERKIVLPTVADPDLPIVEVVEFLTKQNAKRIAAAKNSKWLKLKVKETLPYAVVAIGDPHIDDNGCDLALLRHHMDIIKNTKGMYCIGMGDYENNWVGRLARLWAMQDTSSHTARRLVKWFLDELSPKMLALIKGNHDMWSGTNDLMKWMEVGGAIQQDWIARLEFENLDGSVFRVIAAHDFPGHSQFNELHGNKKEALFGAPADLYVAGHRHTWGLTHGEIGKRDHVYWLARARGYKVVDSYADVGSFDQQNNGHSICAIVVPKSTSSVSKVVCFADIEEGADYLKFKRKQAPK